MNETQLTAPKACNTCYKNISPRRLSLKLLISDLLSTVFNLERGLLFTLWHLIKNPGIVVHEFVSGNRHRYMNPFRLMLLAATLAVVVESITGTIESISIMHIEGNDQESNKAISDFLRQNINLIVLMTVPMLSIGSFIVFRKQKWNLAEHLSVNAYGYSVAAIFGSLYSILLMPLEIETRLIFEGASQLLSFFVAYVYIKTWNLGILKGILLFFLSMIVSVLLIMIIGIFGVLIFNKIF